VGQGEGVLALEPKERPKHLGILKEYIKSLGTGTRDRRVTWSAVKSFYDYHRLTLPSPSRSEASRLFAPSEKERIKGGPLSFRPLGSRTSDS
jgi:hypothetical protein